MNVDKTYNKLILDQTTSYLSNINFNNSPPPDIIEYDLLKLTNDAIDEYNLGPLNKDSDESDPINIRYPYQKKGQQRYLNIKTLLPFQIGEILIKIHSVINIATGGLESDPDKDALGVYQYEGYNKGIYEINETSIAKVARLYNISLNINSLKEVINYLKTKAPRKELNKNIDLIAVNNGIFDYKEKKLLDFNEDFIYLAKSHVNMNFEIKNPKITMPDGEIWDIESWVKDISSNEEIENSLWEIASAILRPHVPWGRSAWLYSERGNNGKGTFCTLLRNLVGESSYSSISLKNFSNPFMLESLTHTNAIIVDENPVGIYIDQADDLKAVTTNDVITINPKYKSPIAFRFNGFMVQCLNEFPKARDKSDSFYRRQLFIPMEKRFEGKERKYIKQDYLNRKDVLEYAMYKVLYKSNFYELSIPEKSLSIMNSYKEYNDPIRQFFKDVEDLCVWDILPFTFLYDFYKAWVRENLPEGKPIGRNFFINSIKILCEESEIFVSEENNQYRITDQMDKSEPLIIEYELKKWYNETYKGSDKDIIANPNLSNKRFRGIKRREDEQK